MAGEISPATAWNAAICRKAAHGVDAWQRDGLAELAEICSPVIQGFAQGLCDP